MPKLMLGPIRWSGLHTFIHVHRPNRWYRTYFGIINVMVHSIGITKGHSKVRKEYRTSILLRRRRCWARTARRSSTRARTPALSQKSGSGGAPSFTISLVEEGATFEACYLYSLYLLPKWFRVPISVYKRRIFNFLFQFIVKTDKSFTHFSLTSEWASSGGLVMRYLLIAIDFQYTIQCFFVSVVYWLNQSSDDIEV